MSLTAATTNAASGLLATAKGTQVVSDNLANLNTPNYARQVLRQSAVTFGSAGGVRVDGIDRVVNETLLSELRSVTSSVAKESLKAEFYKRIETVVGTSGTEGSLEKSLLTLRETLIAATSTPNDKLALKKIALAAESLTKKTDQIFEEIRKEATDAGSRAKKDVDKANRYLEQVWNLNRKIARAGYDELKTATLLDNRDKLIDELSEILPLQAKERSGKSVTLLTGNGIPLLDGQNRAWLEYSENTGVVSIKYRNENTTVEGGSDQLNISEIWDDGGRLGENIKIRSFYTADLHAQLNSFVTNVHESFLQATNNVGPTGQGETLFQLDESDSGIKKISVNSAIYSGGNDQSLWKLRSNEAVETERDKGSTAKLQRFADALSDRRTSNVESASGEQAPILEEIVSFISSISSARLASEDEATAYGAQSLSLTATKAELGVDSDTELQRLIGYERAYAANAHVMRVIQDMFEQLQRW